MLIVLWAAAPAHAGDGFPAGTGKARVYWLEATPVEGSLGVAWKSGDATWLGVFAGGGVPQIDLAFEPANRDFLNIVHAGGVLRYAQSPRTILECGPMVGIGELENDPYDGDDMPNLFAGFTWALLWGGEHWRLGPRLDTVVLFDEGGDAMTFVVSASPLALRVEW